MSVAEEIVLRNSMELGAILEKSMELEEYVIVETQINPTIKENRIVLGQYFPIMQSQYQKQHNWSKKHKLDVLDWKNIDTTSIEFLERIAKSECRILDRFRGLKFHINECSTQSITIDLIFSYADRKAVGEWPHLAHKPKQAYIVEEWGLKLFHFRTKLEMYDDYVGVDESEEFPPRDILYMYEDLPTIQ